MKKLIIILTIFTFFNSNANAKEEINAGKWKEKTGSQKEIIKELQRRILILDKRDVAVARAIGDARARLYHFECGYEQRC